MFQRNLVQQQRVLLILLPVGLCDGLLRRSRNLCLFLIAAAHYDEQRRQRQLPLLLLTIHHSSSTRYYSDACNRLLSFPLGRAAAAPATRYLLVKF